MDFHITQKIVCVNASFNATWRCVKNWPLEKEIYTVRGVCEFQYLRGKGIGLYLEEIINEICPWTSGDTCEVPFPVFRFRPLVEKKTSIELFQKMLLPNNLETV